MGQRDDGGVARKGAAHALGESSRPKETGDGHLPDRDHRHRSEQAEFSVQPS